MPAHPQDTDFNRPARPRSNTNTFASFSAWRRNRPDQLQSAPLPPSPSPAIQVLIDDLTPPAVPSLQHARTLASTLPSQSPLPRPSILSPVLASLCDADSPPSLQSAGYDILSAYWDNPEATTLSTSDRLIFFSLFLGPTSTWTIESWEPRFKALRAFTRFGTDILGIELPFLNVLKGWISGAFEGLLSAGESLDRAERVERERSIELIASFLTSVTEKQDVVARIPEEELAGVLEFYAKLVERGMQIPLPPSAQPYSPTSSPVVESMSSPRSHRRHQSSVSLASLASPTIPGTSSSFPATTKHPADIAANLYLNHLSLQLKILPPSYLGTILPVLFRVSAFYASPLPRLTVVSAPTTSRGSGIEERITETLGSLYAGPYSTTCFLSLKRALFPTQVDTNTSGEAVDIHLSLRTSLGAVRTLRSQVRKSLSSRLARAYISRDSAVTYTHSGAPAHMEVEREIVERAWAKDDIGGWDAGRLGTLLAQGVEAWVRWEVSLEDENLWKERERVLDEAAGVAKDVFQELDAREEEDAELDEQEADAVGDTLFKLATYIVQLKNANGSPFILPLSQPSDAPTPFLRTLASLLARDHTTFLNPPLSSTLLSISGNLTDEDTAKLPAIMTQQHDLSPTSPDWLLHWDNLLSNETLVCCRPATREALMAALQGAYDRVREMPSYRRPLADLVMAFAEKEWRKEEESSVVVEVVADGAGDAVWPILGDEVVSRLIESSADEEDVSVGVYVDFLKQASKSGHVEVEGDDEDDTISIATADMQQSPQSMTTSSMVSPMLSRMQSDYQAVGKMEKESPLPSVMSLLTSLATASGASRSQSMQPQSTSDLKPPSEDPRPRYKRRCAPVGAVSALIYIFHQLALTPLCLSEKNLALALGLFHELLDILKQGQAPRARLAVLQYLMRLRADRDHHLYYAGAKYDIDGLVGDLATLVGRCQESGSGDVPSNSGEDFPPPSGDLRKARARGPQERYGRRMSRGRGGGGLSNPPAPSRSGSRIPISPVRRLVVRAPIWSIPDAHPFIVNEMDSPSEMLISYDPEGPDRRPVLSVSEYLDIVAIILESETDWEILSYLLCHLPTQLANKHLFCGPKSRDSITRILKSLCTSILNGELGSKIEPWPSAMKPRDAQGLAYHTLSVLISYRRCFDIPLRHLLVEVFQAGLNGLPATIKCCLHALTLASFELQSSITKSLSRILEKLSQIMSMPEMAVHILGFLSVVGSLRPLHVNFTEGDFKMVFGVALQYLQYHNQNKVTPSITWALSQHVRILSFYIVYVWFLAIKLPNRPRHVKFITRQLLLANEGNQDIDEPTEVCFDWLARYTFASADPRPSRSLLDDIVMSPINGEDHAQNDSSEKTWLIGNSILTIRSVERLGWVEVLSRRPSGFTKFLCRIENVPLTSAGEVNPDLVSVVGSLLMDRDIPKAELPLLDQSPAQNESIKILTHADSVDDEEGLSPPDPITGYVWSGSAPSQRRKDVVVDPAFLALQLSPYPDPRHSSNIRRLKPVAGLQRTIAGLDRIPVIDTHKVGILYVAPGQVNEVEILRNTHGSPAYTRFLEGLGRLINLRGQVDVYAGGLNPDEDGEYAYAWWDDIGQILYHTATMMPNNPSDDLSTDKKRHIGNDYVRIVWNDSGMPYRFDTLSTQFQFVNIVIEPHSVGAIAAFSNNLHENEFFKITIQSAPGMTEFAPIGRFKLISADNLPLLARQLSLLADWFASVFERTQGDTVQVEMKTNWHARLEAIRRLRSQTTEPEDDGESPDAPGIMIQEVYRDFTNMY